MNLDSDFPSETPDIEEYQNFEYHDHNYQNQNHQELGTSQLLQHQTEQIPIAAALNNLINVL